MTQPSPFRRALTALLLAAAAAATVTPVLRAQAVPSDAVLRGFQKIGDYMLMVNGKADKGGEIYQNDRIPAILILGSTLPSPVLLTPRAGTVETVQLMKVVQAEGRLGRPAGRRHAGAAGEVPDAGPERGLHLRGAEGEPDPQAAAPRAAQGRRPQVVQPRVRPLGAGLHPERAAMIAALKKVAQPATVRVFFGSWCPHCRQHRAAGPRVEDAARRLEDPFEYYGLPRDFKDPEVKRLNIKSVPTAVVYVNGRVAGRIEGNDWNAAPEASLSRLLGGGKPAAGK